MPLPTSRGFLSKLFASFPHDHSPASDIPQASNSLINNAHPNVKNLLLTLHVLFPNELLPALDLLDRKQVTRLILSLPLPGDDQLNTVGDGRGDGNIIDPQVDASTAAPVESWASLREGTTRVVYYVQSSHQPPRSRFPSSSSRTYDALAGNRSYEVRLKAWNCTCPAFAFASVACMSDDLSDGWGVEHDGSSIPGVQGDVLISVDEAERAFGGLCRGDGEMPVCKHLLACFLAESWMGFHRYVEERHVSREEMSGWAAGWGG